MSDEKSMCGEAVTVLAETKLPMWQDLAECQDGPKLPARIVQNNGYGGVSIEIGTMEIYVEADKQGHVAVRIWLEANGGDDPTFTHDISFSKIGLRT